MPKLIQYVAFLRGINLGKRTVKMAKLKEVLEALGYQKVRTILASGNVVFELKKKSAKELEVDLERELEQAFGFKIAVLIRTIEELEQLQVAEPFKGIEVTPQTRLYVTFLSEDSPSQLELPYASADGEFSILKKMDGALFSVLVLSGDRGTVDAMGIIEKEFGKRVTTRNWNTVEKILKRSIA